MKKFCTYMLCSLVVAGFIATAEDALSQADEDSRIEFFYGGEQQLGQWGTPQRWVNVLGSISCPDEVESLAFSLNGGKAQPLSMGPDKRRLARPGDFNIEIDHQHLKAGGNQIEVYGIDRDGNRFSRSMRIQYTPDRVWPLPYSIDWSTVDTIQDVAQIVDGRWRLTPHGVRNEIAHYDRVLAIGDRSWRNYQATVTIRFHGFTGPTPNPPHFGVTHAGIGLRWRGHHDDGNQPRIKWHPLGAATEFQLFPGWAECRWRILGGSGKKRETMRMHNIEPNQPYFLKARVQTLPDGDTLYRVKIWQHEEDEPALWDLCTTEGPSDYQNGCLLLVAHNSEVTFGNIEIIPLN